MWDVKLIYNNLFFEFKLTRLRMAVLFLIFRITSASYGAARPAAGREVGPDQVAVRTPSAKCHRRTPTQTLRV